VTYPDSLSVGARSRDLGVDCFTQEYLVFGHRHCRVTATGDGLVVSYDYRLHRKASIPSEMRAGIKRVEGVDAGG
jgi:acyl-CoA thioesterase FadM